MHEYVVVDAFSRTPLEGNPVAVFFDADDLTSDQMQRIAKEMNLSEVTFVLSAQQGADARIRIFTPVNELPFAGHPLLGTAVALGEVKKTDSLRLETAMGIIPFEFCDDGGVAVRMRQPVPTWKPYERVKELLQALGVESSTVPVEIYRNGPRHVFVGLPSVAALSALRPRPPRPGRSSPTWPPTASPAAARTGDTRMFSPAYGVVEDAATGSAAGPLAIHLARHGLAEYGQEIEILQGADMGRPSYMFATAHGSGDRVDDVRVGGHGVVVARGVIHV